MKFRLLLLSVLCGSGFMLQAESNISESAWKKLHQKAVNRERRIIYNNDGNEPVQQCTVATKEEMLKHRSHGLEGSHVDSIFYCTTTSGFGMFRHFTKVGQLFTTREGRFTNNMLPEFFEKNIDPLRVITEFGRSNKIEVFWSFRVNDTHDGSRTDYGPIMFRTNTLKLAHPEWLIGSVNKRPKYGVWSAVDFGVPEIRDIAFRLAEEVCQNYDVDGIELDFFRHAFFFRRSATGEACGQTELDQMTSLMQRIRTMTEAEGKKRGKPILISMRVPDSVEYCKFIGLDLERWLKEGLLDLLVAGGYTQLNPWDYSVKLGHKYGVKVYASLDESRIREEKSRTLRTSFETYRGRAQNVWASGADGVYMFNYDEPKSPLWRELGDPKVLRTLDRNYFASIRGVGSMYLPHQKFLTVPTLNPTSPVLIAPGQTGGVDFYVGEDLSKLPKTQHAVLRVQVTNAPAASSARMTLNGKKLPEGQFHAGWFEYPVTGKMVKRGDNRLELTTATEAKRRLALTDLYVSITKK